MKIQVSKVFANYINSCAKRLGFKCEARVLELTPTQYSALVPWREVCNFDFNYNTAKYKVIRISYPFEYYALPKYFSSYMLNREFTNRKVKTTEGLDRMIRDLCEI